MPRVFGYQISPGTAILNGPFALADNQSSPTTVISYSAASYSYIQLQYSISRNGSTRTGLLMIASDGVNVNIIDEDLQTADVGIIFSVALSGGSILVKYTSTATGFGAQLKYYEQKWN